MIKQLTIQNFQKHSRFNIEFDKFITTITGETDSGKSSIIRALKWVSRNHPQGDSFIREGTKGTTVRLLIGPDKISRKRSKSTNTYNLNEKEFKAFGFDVPDTISNILNLDDINFQGQHDPPFWFSLSAPEVSRQLNSVVDLGIIDTALSTVGKRVRHFSDTIKFVKERLQSIKKKKEDLKWIVKIDIQLKKVETADSTRAGTAASAIHLHDTVQSILHWAKAHHIADQRLQHLNRCGVLGQRAKKLNLSTTSLIILIKEIQSTKLVINTKVPDTKKIRESIDSYNIVSRNRKILHQIIEDIKLISTKLNYFILELKRANKDIKEKTKGLCPICGGKLGNE